DPDLAAALACRRYPAAVPAGAGAGEAGLASGAADDVRDAAAVRLPGAQVLRLRAGAARLGVRGGSARGRVERAAELWPDLRALRLAPARPVRGRAGKQHLQHDHGAGP